MYSASTFPSMTLRPLTFLYAHRHDEFYFSRVISCGCTGQTILNCPFELSPTCSEQ